jgi:hypothetical protein
MKIEYFDPHFFGTETWWKHPYGFLYTDSLMDFCEKHKAYWTLDVVGSYMCFYAREDTGLPNVVEQFIEYTDLDVSIKLYLEEKVLMFPSDH